MLIFAGITLIVLPLPFLIWYRKKNSAFFGARKALTQREDPLGIAGGSEEKTVKSYIRWDHEITSQISFQFAAMTPMRDAALNFSFHVPFSH